MHSFIIPPGWQASYIHDSVLFVDYGFDIAPCRSDIDCRKHFTSPVNAKIRDPCNYTESDTNHVQLQVAKVQDLFSYDL